MSKCFLKAKKKNKDLRKTGKGKVEVDIINDTCGSYNFMKAAKSYVKQFTVYSTAKK
jgi:hypothetical protein